MRYLLPCVLLLGATATPVFGQPKVSSEPVIIEHYYRIKWGSADEFKRLYKRNHPSFGILLSPIIAGAAMAFSSVAVIGNSLRLRAVHL